MMTNLWKQWIQLLFCLLLVHTNVQPLSSQEYNTFTALEDPLKINQLLTQIELDFFAEILYNHDQFTEIILYLEQYVSPSDTDKTTFHHFLYARSLYLSALIFPEETSMTDIFQAVLIEEALIPFINTLNYNAILSFEEKSVWQTLAISFYLTQAHYSFLGQDKPSHAVTPLQIALSLNPQDLFLLYELAVVEQHLPNAPLTINPTKELETLLKHPHTTAMQRSLIYLMLATLLPQDYANHITYAHTAWLAAITLGENPTTLSRYLYQNLPKPLHPDTEKLFIHDPM